MNYISTQIERNYQHARKCFEEYESHPNDQQLLTLSCILKLLHIGKDEEGFLEGCENAIIDVLDSLVKNIHKRGKEFSDLWSNEKWVALTSKYLGINYCEPEFDSVDVFDYIEYERCRVPYFEDKENWNIFSKGLFDVTYKNNHGEKILFNLLDSMRRGERVTIGFLYDFISRTWGNDIGREIKDEFLTQTVCMSPEDLKELVFLPLKRKEDIGPSFDGAMAILAMMK